MKYSIKELSDIAGVSARTLRYYDEINLLKPSFVNEAGYRFYGKKEVDLLWQILFYRERGFDLKSIQRIIYQEDFDICHALETHLLELEKEKERMESLIRTVKQTLIAMKGETKMDDKERFQVFKERLVQENEEKYGEEIRKTYGDEQVDAANRRILNMSREDFERFQHLEQEILSKLEQAVKQGDEPESETGREIVILHKEWLCMTWKTYAKEAHKGVAAMYVTDERFRQYYDRSVQGCAKFLNEAICFWAGRL